MIGKRHAVGQYRFMDLIGNLESENTEGEFCLGPGGKLPEDICEGGAPWGEDGDSQARLRKEPL